MTGFGANMWTYLFPKRGEFPVKPWGATWQIAIKDTDTNALLIKYMEITKSMVPKAIIAKPGQFDQVWSDYMKQIDDAGRVKLEEAYTKLVKERIDLWSK